MNRYILDKECLNNVTIYTSSERRVVASAEIFTAALFDNLAGLSSTPSSRIHSQPPTNPGSPMVPSTPKQSKETPQLIVRPDLLDDSNAAKDLMDDVKKRLKILLRPGESEKRPELTWPKSMKKEPVEVVREVIELLSSFRTIMRRNYETLDIDKIQERWRVPLLNRFKHATYPQHRCCGDEPWLFRERWEKLFEDFCDVKQEKFDPSRVRRQCPPHRTLSGSRRGRCLSYTTPSSTAPSITVSSSLQSLTRTAGKATRTRTASCTNCTAVRRRCST